MFESDLLKQLKCPNIYVLGLVGILRLKPFGGLNIAMGTPRICNRLHPDGLNTSGCLTVNRNGASTSNDNVCVHMLRRNVIQHMTHDSGQLGPVIIPSLIVSILYMNVRR